MSNADAFEFMTAEAYLQAEATAETRSEYIEGWIRAMAGASVRHNRIKRNCLICLGTELRGKPCEPFGSDMKLRWRQDRKTRFYYPDLQVVCQSNAATAVFQDAPVLIIEVLSPATRRYDLDEKMDAYLQIPSLECYLVLEQHQPNAIIMRRTAEGFLRQTISGVNQTIEFPFIGCRLSMNEIYEGIQFTPTCVQEPTADYEWN